MSSIERSWIIAIQQQGRTIAQIANQIADGDFGHGIYDSNGNHIGEWQITEEQRNA